LSCYIEAFEFKTYICSFDLHLNIFGLTTLFYSCICDLCKRAINVNKFAPHLEKCISRTENPRRSSLQYNQYSSSYSGAGNSSSVSQQTTPITTASISSVHRPGRPEVSRLNTTSNTTLSTSSVAPSINIKSNAVDTKTGKNHSNNQLSRTAPVNTISSINDVVIQLQPNTNVQTSQSPYSRMYSEHEVVDGTVTGMLDEDLMYITSQLASNNKR
jgi:hypothetical protein